MAADRAVVRLHIFGIRHHGPGSARSLLAALKRFDPAIVLIEGPPDANDIVAFAASPAMAPPLAILVHELDNPATANFFPFAVYSPEWQAMRWALAKGRPVRFIDLPAANRLALRCESASHEPAEGNDKETVTSEPEQQGPATSADDADAAAQPAEADLAAVRRDPLAYLAQIAGYRDSEHGGTP